MKLCPTCGTEYPDEQKFCPNDGATLRSTTQGNLIGAIIADRYHISSKLGEGGMGAVYLGEHVRMGRKSAIKVMSTSMANDPEAIARFNREAANAARINHPNVCAIYDFGETDDGVIYLAMEFIEGEALTDLIKREGALDPARAGAILRQTADALQAAHDLGIVHRDLKPDNIMIARDRDDADVVKVVDFGIAKAMGGEEGQNVTKTGLVVGTPEYMSPEQLSGDVLDGRSDIYSLALVFYRMLTGVLPFQAGSAQETMIKRLTDDPLPLNQARPGVTYPDALQQVMTRALARMPSERFESAGAFGVEAAEAVMDMPASAGPVDVDGATQLIDTGEITDATAQIAQTRVAGEAVTAPQTEPVTPTTPQPQPPPTQVAAKKKLPMGAIAAAAVVVAGLGVGTFMLQGGNNGVADPDSTTTGVTDDTAQVVVQRESLPVEPVSNGRRDGDPPPRDTAAPVRDTAPPIPAGIVVDPAGADDWLFARVVDVGVTAANASGIKDTAEAYYNHAGISPRDRAFAANAVAQAWLQLGNREEALRWGREAVRLDGTSQAYQSFVAQLRGQL